MKKYWLILLPIFILITFNVYLISKIKSPISPNPIIKTKLSPTPQPEKITLAVVGDISLAREVNYQIQQQNNPLSPFEKIAPTIKKADLAMANLESPLINNCPIARSGYKFCGEANNVKGLTFAGFDTLNLSNNHSMNYGLDGYQETKEILTKNNLGYFDNEKIDYQTINGIKLGIIGFDDTVEKVKSEKFPGHASGLPRAGKVKSQEVKKNVDILIVNFHWGVEYQTEPSARQRELAHFAIDNGADIIIGHHPHVVQPLKYYQGKPIFYSLGNFVFDQMWSEETKTGAIGWLEIENGQIIKAEIKKTYMTNCCQPELTAN